MRSFLHRDSRLPQRGPLIAPLKRRSAPGGAVRRAFPLGAGSPAPSKTGQRERGYSARSHPAQTPLGRRSQVRALKLGGAKLATAWRPDRLGLSRACRSLAGDGSWGQRASCRAFNEATAFCATDPHARVGNIGELGKSAGRHKHKVLTPMAQARQVPELVRP
jgi:hypothetical protein